MVTLVLLSLVALILFAAAGWTAIEGLGVALRFAVKGNRWPFIAWLVLVAVLILGFSKFLTWIATP